MESSAPGIALRDLISEVIGLANRLRKPGLNLEARELAGGLLATARIVHDIGPQSVPRIAQARRTSRQNIQAAVNRLRQLGLIELKSNPAHKRSLLVALTGKGHAELAAAEEKEATNADVMLSSVSEDQIAAATDLLKRVREQLFDLERHGGVPSEKLPVKQRRRTVEAAAAEPPYESEMPVSLL